MTADRIRRVAVVGSGPEAWLTAAVLSRVLAPQKVAFVVVEPECAADSLLGHDETALPPLGILHQLLALDEIEFMRSTGATFKLAAEYRDWGQRTSSFFQPLGETGINFEGIPFHLYWLETETAGDQTPLCDYSLSAVAAKLGRFAHPASDQSSVLSTLAYAYQFDRISYASLLRGIAENAGVTRIPCDISGTTRAANGHIEALVLENGAHIDADLFIDCSGSSALLIEGVMHSGFEDWSSLLPCDRAVSVSCSSATEQPPMAQFTARQAGWEWQIPLQHRIGHGYVYSSHHLADDAAAATLLSRIEGSAANQARVQVFRSGRRRDAWIGNVVAIGASAGFLEPLACTGLHMAQRGILRLIELFPDKNSTIEAAEYSRLMANEFERARDFVLLHYLLAKRDDAPFWKHCRAISAPPLLLAKIDNFANRARNLVYDEETFRAPSWAALCLGMDLRPKRRDPLLARIDPRQIAAKMAQMRAAIRQAAERLQPHHAYLARIGATAPLRET